MARVASGRACSHAPSAAEERITPTTFAPYAPVVGSATQHDMIGPSTANPQITLWESSTYPGQRGCRVTPAFGPHLADVLTDGRQRGRRRTPLPPRTYQEGRAAVPPTTGAPPPDLRTGTCSLAADILKKQGSNPVWTRTPADVGLLEVPRACGHSGLGLTCEAWLPPSCGGSPGATGEQVEVAADTRICHPVRAWGVSGIETTKGAPAWRGTKLTAVEGFSGTASCIELNFDVSAQ
ncbi:hypothetical protein C8Q77DRAFT_1073840 [Trametes polyzona]|nr:hypothetical protein C8Q77DRAFT_1073840 [Trametes polyzona]